MFGQLIGDRCNVGNLMDILNAFHVMGLAIHGASLRESRRAVPDAEGAMSDDPDEMCFQGNCEFCDEIYARWAENWERSRMRKESVVIERGVDILAVELFYLAEAVGTGKPLMEPISAGFHSEEHRNFWRDKARSFLSLALGEATAPEAQKILLRGIPEMLGG